MSRQELTLESVEVRSVCVPLKRPVVSKVGVYREWPLILIDLRTAEGVVGRAYLEPYLTRSLKYLVNAIEDLAAGRTGKPIRPLDDFSESRKLLNIVGYEGVAMIAIAGLDMAAWDALAKAADLPLARFLGGTIGPVPAYNSNGLWLTDVSRLGREAVELVDEGGFTAIKLRLGRDRLDDDLRALDAVRAAVGPAVDLMVDFNQGLSLAAALRWCHALDDRGLCWFEEPVAYNDLRGAAQLAGELSTPVQLGENFYGPRELWRAVDAGACDLVMLDLMRIGGVSGWLRAAPAAAAAGIQVSSHLYPEVSAHLLRVTETAHWLEWEDWAYPILAEPFDLDEGRLIVPDRAGCGIEWDEQAVRRFQLAL
ncbi:enolase C-terminal domain-like protein [Rugosimonospora acidiphila]|uniref:Enolase C-terminal domain-like protein n=1 Tax=Rugosimonospora acidiphila TaxID=556531 RepID=A0ABP9RV14_9ACTN